MQEFVQGHKDLRVQLGDQADDLRLDVVHVGPLGQLDPVKGFTAPCWNLAKICRDLGAVIGLVVVSADLDAVAPDVDAVSDLGQPLQEGCGCRSTSRMKRSASRVVREVLAERSKSS